MHPSFVQVPLCFTLFLVVYCCLFAIETVESFSLRNEQQNHNRIHNALSRPNDSRQAKKEFSRSKRRQLPLFSETRATTEDGAACLLTQSVAYKIASVDLSMEWLELVRNDQVSVTTEIPVPVSGVNSKDGGDDKNDSIKNIGVKYGVRLYPDSAISMDSPQQQRVRFMEFVEPISDTEAIHPIIASMNATLQKIAGLETQPQPTTKVVTDNNDSSNNIANTQDSSSNSSSSSLQFRRDGNFVAQLQLVRTLRPPPSPEFGTANVATAKSSSCMPPYNSATDSFVTGPLRLELRPRVAQLIGAGNDNDSTGNSSSKDQNRSRPLTLTTPWDVYHNISPADVRGHFLLVPTLQYPDKNWRGQTLIESDCHDLVQLTSSIRDPVGSLLVCFNSVGAGASQNHIHCHLWPSPPIALLAAAVEDATGEDLSVDYDDHGSDGHDHSHSHMLDDNDDDDDDDTIHGWSCYAPSRIESIYDFVDIGGGDCSDGSDEPLVQVSYLNYPCFCVELSSVTSAGKEEESLDALGKAVWGVLSCLGDAPHNVCMNNRIGYGDETSVDVDVKIFVRSRERSPTVVTATKLGASEMMGVFHLQSLEQLAELGQRHNTNKPTMVQALEEVSYEDTEELWNSIKDKLSSMKF